MVQAFRRASAGKQRPLRLQGLDPDAVLLRNFDHPVHRPTGRELMEEGLSITIDGKPGAAIVTYLKKP